MSKSTDDEDLIGIINSKTDGYHSHLIYRFNKAELDGDFEAIDIARHYYDQLITDAKVIRDQPWDKKKIGDSSVVRKVVKIKEDIDTDGSIDTLWFFVEAKEIDGRFYLQIVYHAVPVTKDKLNLIGKVMNSVGVKGNK